MKIKPFLKRIAFLAGAFFVLVVLGFVIWALSPYQAEIEAVEALQGNDRIQVVDGDWITFSPWNEKITTGLILYPGGRVAPEAYALAARDIAACGNLVVIARMPLNLAVFGINHAERVMKDHPEIENWVVGGHSLGGAMAVAFADQNPDQAVGVLLWASFPGDQSELSQKNINVMSIYASHDGLATPQEIEEKAYLLPDDASYVLIEGGNHAGFGSYGSQKGDGQARISREDQRAMVVEASCDFLDEPGGQDGQ